ncbi:hypothetical protein RFI_03215 [Reticulomyxa filosa]|uniref:Reverse transcriptase domain-containing protein n=1 Tax=Reticulomyxa filosa TaxID=46433 RepID=X6P6U5_RETFI|nr:hypothetical protein RFI_03215 [Reticulomyxa filosa]|eukprot:ETO33881.1 hypothetical protein RFI_03215 [Reticulomyxa filosa]
MHPKCSNKVQQPQYLKLEIEIDFKAQPDVLDQWSFPNPEEQEANRNNKDAWYKWMVMIRTIIWDPGRGGQAHINNTTKTIMNRIKLWNSYLKHSSDIFNVPKKASTNSNKHNDTIARNKRCIKYAAIGELSKAFKSLSPSPAIQYNDAVITALRNKHPEEAPPNLEPYQTESNTLTNWAKVAQLIIEGKICSDAQAIAYGARLIAIPKPDNTPRPIAVGSLLRRSAGAILLQRHSEQISKILGPNQLGVNVKQGVEIFSHGFKAISKHIQTNNKGVFVKIDFQNAFNTCKRRKLLELVRKQIPELYGYAR